MGGFCNFVLNFIILWLFVIFFGFNFFVGSYLLVEYVAGLNLFILLFFFIYYFFFLPVVVPRRVVALAQGLAGLTSRSALPLDKGFFRKPNLSRVSKSTLNILG